MSTLISAYTSVIELQWGVMNAGPLNFGEGTIEISRLPGVNAELLSIFNTSTHQRVRISA